MVPGERFNSISHRVGTALAIAGAVALIVSVSLFGAMLIALYGTSTRYHAVRPRRAKSVLRRLDHPTIFLLIAGTYTPFTLVTLRGALGWTLFAVIWLMVAWGMWQVLRAPEGHEQPPWPHLVMGWLGVTAMVPLVERIGAHSAFWRVLGGALYSAGVLFYVNDKRWRHAHGVWHLFVMGASAAPVVTVLFFVR
jgi:hemolysin III